MPVPRQVLNAFTAAEVRSITGLSLPMIDYLRRTEFLCPAYSEGAGRRGRVRYYSYRDLLAARLVQRMREMGVELYRLKEAIQTLSRSSAWLKDRRETLRWLVSDGKDVMLQSEDGFLDSLRGPGQRAFAFVINLGGLEAEVRSLVPDDKRAFFDLENRQIRYPEPARARHRRAG